MYVDFVVSFHRLISNVLFPLNRQKNKKVIYQYTANMTKLVLSVCWLFVSVVSEYVCCDPCIVASELKDPI